MVKIDKEDTGSNPVCGLPVCRRSRGDAGTAAGPPSAWVPARGGAGLRLFGHGKRPGHNVVRADSPPAAAAVSAA